MSLFAQLVKVSFRRSHIWGEKGDEAFRNFATLQFYCFGALSRWKKIEEIRTRLVRGSSRESPEAYQELALEIWSFFSCGREFFRALEMLVSLDGCCRASDLISGFVDVRESFMEGCDVFENLASVLTGSFVADFGRVDTDGVWVGGRKLSLTGELALALVEIYGEVVRRALKSAGEAQRPVALSREPEASQRRAVGEGAWRKEES